MRVSVVIPSYNSGPLVAEAVASVLAQTRPADEVIVVDDGSTDDTAARLAAFGPPVRVVRKENGGVSSARNRGVAEATGDAIAFLDADDVWNPRKLELHLPEFDRRPEVGLIGTGTYPWPGDHPAPAVPAFHLIPFDRLVVRNALVTSTIIARAAALRDAGPFDLTLRGPEDYDLWLRVARRAAVGRLDAPLAGYRTVAGSLSKNAERMEAGMRAILGKLEADGAFRGRPLLRRKAWGFFRYSCGYMWLQAGHLRAAAGRLLRSLAGYPLPYPRADVRHPFGRVRLLLAATARALRSGVSSPRPEATP